MSTDTLSEEAILGEHRIPSSASRAVSSAASPGERPKVQSPAFAKAIVLLGPPGSGKGTQAALLSERLGLPHISTGDILRDRILLGDAFGNAIARRIDVGRFVPDEWIERMLDERLALADCRPGVILDGFPRTLPQAERFVENCAAVGNRPATRIFVVRLTATAEVLAARFSGRRQCSECGTLFHLRYQPSLAGAYCDRMGCTGHLEERPDDRPEFLARRLNDFDTLTAPVAACLEACAARTVSVDAGYGGPEAVLGQLLAGLGPVEHRGTVDELGEFSNLIDGQVAPVKTPPFAGTAVPRAASA